MASYVSREDESNPVLWLVIRAVIMALSCPLGIADVSHKKSSPKAILTKLVRSITPSYTTSTHNIQVVNWISLCFRLEPTRPITLHQKALFLLWLSIIFLWVTLKTKRYILKWRDKWKAKRMEDEEKDLAEKGMNFNRCMIQVTEKPYYCELQIQLVIATWEIILSPGQTDLQVVASRSNLNMRNLGWVAKRRRTFSRKFMQVVKKKNLSEATA